MGMNYKKAEEYVHSLTRFGSQLGLERMANLLRRLDNPQDKLKFLHIAGTNGKGSTAKLCSEVLYDAGYMVGLYISPFVVHFRERFQINGKAITRTRFAALATRVAIAGEELARQGQQVTEFEVITAIAFLYFYEAGCNVVCLEVGLGGRLDATNVIKTPELAIITSIAMDHVDILGDTIEKIAYEKAGIIKENTDVVTYPLQALEAVGVFMEVCSERGSILTVPNPAAVEILRCDPLGSQFCYGGCEYTLKLAGRHQIFNAVAVIEGMKLLATKGFAIEEKNIVRGLARTRFAARFERMSEDPLIIVDGGHDKQSTEALAQTLSMVEASPMVAIMGMMSDKDYRSAVAAIAGICKGIITVPVPSNPRALTAEALAKAAFEVCDEVYPITDYTEALVKALELVGENGCVVVCGSLYMASEMRKTIKEHLKNKKGK